LVDHLVAGERGLLRSKSSAEIRRVKASRPWVNCFSLTCPSVPLTVPSAAARL
jgi:hypothetical protein